MLQMKKIEIEPLRKASEGACRVHIADAATLEANSLKATQAFRTVPRSA
jgi:hypothetical protein